MGSAPRKWPHRKCSRPCRLEVGETTHHSVSTLSLELTKRFDLDVSFIWDRITNPKVGADGVQPKPDDFRLVVGLGVDF